MKMISKIILILALVFTVNIEMAEATQNYLQSVPETSNGGVCEGVSNLKHEKKNLKKELKGLKKKQEELKKKQEELKDKKEDLKDKQHAEETNRSRFSAHRGNYFGLGTSNNKYNGYGYIPIQVSARYSFYEDCLSSSSNPTLFSVGFGYTGKYDFLWSSGKDSIEDSAPVISREQIPEFIFGFSLDGGDKNYSPGFTHISLGHLSNGQFWTPGKDPTLDKNIQSDRNHPENYISRSTEFIEWGMRFFSKEWKNSKTGDALTVSWRYYVDLFKAEELVQYEFDENNIPREVAGTLANYKGLEFNYIRRFNCKNLQNSFFVYGAGIIPCHVFVGLESGYILPVKGAAVSLEVQFAMLYARIRHGHGYHYSTYYDKTTDFEFGLKFGDFTYGG